MAKKLDELNQLPANSEQFQFPLAQNNPAEDDLGENMEGVNLDFDRVKIPAGGGLTFEVPGDDPDNPDTVRELVGVIIDHHLTRTYWENQEYTGESRQPDCTSPDGKIGIGEPGGDCRTCPMNQWGSAAVGRGKACRAQRVIYFLREGTGLPIILTLPPTSLRNFDNFLSKRIVGQGRRTYGVVTKITLKKTTTKNNITYSQAQFSVDRDLTPPEKVNAVEYVREIRDFIHQQNGGDAPASGGKVTLSDDDIPFA
jgi:hypothetical protein